MKRRHAIMVAVILASLLALTVNGWCAQEPLKESNIKTTQSVEGGKVCGAKITVESSNGGPGIVKMQADYQPGTILLATASLTVEKGYYKVELLNNGKTSLVMEAKDGKIIKGTGRMSANTDGDVVYRVTSKNAKNSCLELSLKPVEK